jgi:histidinol dehydrogenase
MRVWHLEKEQEEFVSTIASAKEQKKTGVRQSVEAIKTSVLDQPTSAFVEYGRRFDGWTKDYSLKVDRQELLDAASTLSKRDMQVLKGMIKNVSCFHRFQKQKPRTYNRGGLKVIEEAVPVERALVYVPGGKAPYPSSLVMGVVPAKIAGVKEIYVTTPAHDGQINPFIAAAALLLEIDGLYRIGGAQAIYGFTCGLGDLPKVDMIVGPGNAYVEEAKRDVYGQVGIDMLAGPSELVVLATRSFSPQVLAWDLFSQAEHDEMAMVGLFSPSLDDLYSLLKTMERLMASNTRREIIEKSLSGQGFLVHYSDINTAISVIDKIAPEHLEVIGDEDVAARIKYSGVTYVGDLTCVAMGDYYIGTNHILPTGAAGRFSSGLSVERFTKRKVLVKIEKSFLAKYGENASYLAQVEGFHAHSEAIKARKEYLT